MKRKISCAFILGVIASIFEGTSGLYMAPSNIAPMDNDTPSTYQPRLCVAESHFEACQEMIRVTLSSLPNNNSQTERRVSVSCVAAPDKISCIDRIIKGDADWMILEPEELYVAHRFLASDGLVVISDIRSAEYASRSYRYAPVSVIRKSAGIQGISDLKGKRSCHTSFGGNAGWKVPFSHLFTMEQLKCANATINAVEKDLASVEKYFGPACAPGPWVPDSTIDANLKNKYSQLCQLCNDSATCTKSDNYAGYVGALRCLTENNGDVAWTKFDAVQEFFRLNESTPLEITDQYELLCRDGSRVPLTAENPCTWAHRPWKTVVMTSRLSFNYDIIRTIQNETSELREIGQIPEDTPQWFTKVLELAKTTDIFHHHSPHRVKTLAPQRYLLPTSYSETIWHPSCGIYDKSLRICVYNQVELQKCNALKLAAIGQRISPGFSCVLGTSDNHCSRLVSKGDADLMVANAWVAGKLEASQMLTPRLVPIIRAQEPSGEVNGTTTPHRYALAVIRPEIAGDFQGNLGPLRGKRSCHGSIWSVAGWNAVLSVLRDAGEISGRNCALPVALSQYFTQMCVPGVPNAKRKIPGLSSETMCSGCAGDGPRPGEALTPETVCEDGSNERYQGSKGALLCLEDGTADVAFIDHVALLDKLKYPTQGSENWRLLCRNGTVTNLENFKACHWGTVPSQRIYARDGEADQVFRQNARTSFHVAQDKFRLGGKQEGVLKMFGDYFGIKNLIFESSVVGLQLEPTDRDLAEQQNKLLQDFNFCKLEGHAHHRIAKRAAGEWSPVEQI